MGNPSSNWIRCGIISRIFSGKGYFALRLSVRRKPFGIMFRAFQLHHLFKGRPFQPGHLNKNRRRIKHLIWQGVFLPMLKRHLHHIVQRRHHFCTPYLFEKPWLLRILLPHFRRTVLLLRTTAIARRLRMSYVSAWHFLVSLQRFYATDEGHLGAVS